MPEARRKERRDRKAELLEAARRLFAAEGYAAVSMRDIADAVGIAQGGIYNHFGGKLDILSALMKGHMEAVLAAATDALQAEIEPAARLEIFARFHVRYHIDHAEDVFLAHMELRSLDPDARAALMALRDRHERLLHDIVAAGRRTGAFRVADVQIQTRAILSMLAGVAVWHPAADALDRDRVIDCYAAAVLQSVGLTPAARG